MKSLFSLMILISSLSAIGQIIISPTTLEHSEERIPNTEQSYVYYLDITNQGSETETIFWELFVGETLPENWNITVCDLKQCYPAGTTVNLANKPNIIEPGKTIQFTIHVDIDSIATDGKATLSIMLYKDSAHKNILAATDPDAIIEYYIKTSNEDITNKATLLYPNPCHDYFQIANAEKVKNVIIYTASGQKWIGSENGKYDISQIYPGLYQVQIIHQDGTVLTTKFIKM